MCASSCSCKHFMALRQSKKLASRTCAHTNTAMHATLARFSEFEKLHATMQPARERERVSASEWVANAECCAPGYCPLRVAPCCNIHHACNSSCTVKLHSLWLQARVNSGKRRLLLTKHSMVYVCINGNLLPLFATSSFLNQNQHCCCCCCCQCFY